MSKQDFIKDPIGEIFESINKSDDDNSLELFSSGDITLRTQLNNKEVVLSNCLFVENEIIKSQFKSKTGKSFDLYGDFLSNFKKHKVSLDRQSRGEFVNVNLKNTFDRDLNRMANLKNLTESRN